MVLESCSLCHSTVFKSRVSVTNDVYEHLRAPNTLPENILSDTSALLSSVEKDLDDYESEIHRLQIRIADIQNRRERLRTYAENLHSLLSPIRRLPNEVLTHCFGYACIENDLTHGCLPAWTLGSVCLRWRQLTIGCPELWSNIITDLTYWENFDEVVRRRIASIVNLYLARSKSHPLDLIFFGPERPDGSDNPVFSRIAQQSFRWKHVFFSTATDFFPGNYPTWNSLDFPILDTLRLASSYPPDDQECSLEMLRNIPVLRAFHALGMYCLWDRSSGFPLPSALCDLEHDFNAGNFFEVLDNCPNIHRLFISTRGQSTTTAACPPRLLSELYSLSVTLITSWEENIEDDFFSSVLSSLTAPRLTDLALKRAYNQEELAQFHTIQSFLTRSSCSLQVLSLKNIAVTDSELVTILKHCVTLEALLIVDKYPCSPTAEPVITKAFLESLHSSKRSSIQKSPPPIVKSLRSLTLTVESSEFDAAVFVDMVSSRWIPDRNMAKTIGISCLRSVELFLPAQMRVDREAYQPLLPFEKAGMMIVVKQEKTEGYVF